MIKDKPWFRISLSLIIFTFIGGCEENEPPSGPGNPSIMLESGDSFISTDTTVTAGTYMTFSINASSTENLTNFIIKAESDSIYTYFDTGFNSKELHWTGKFQKNLKEEEIWHFIIRDRWSNESETKFTIKLDSNSTFRPLMNIDGQILFAQDHVNSFDSFFSLRGAPQDWSSYSYNECSADTGIQKLIDICYYFGPELATIASPGANIETGVYPGDFSEWLYKNTTRFNFVDVTYSQFADMENDSLILLLYDESSAKRKAKILQKDDCYVFRLQSGRLGMFHVAEIVGENDGQIELDIRLQAE